MSADTSKKKRVDVSGYSGLYWRATTLDSNVSGVSERALREYVDRLEDGSGQPGVLVGKNGADESDETSDDTVDNANNDTDPKRADTPTEEILDEYRRFARSVLNRGENTVELYTRYIGRLPEHADVPLSRLTRDDITPYLDSEGDVSNATQINVTGAVRVFFRDFP